LIESTGELGKGLKLADFGSCRGIYSKQPYTEYISTRCVIDGGEDGDPRRRLTRIGPLPC
jgi:hypothetical protein